jgi:ATP-dependent helicase/nuclease subunit A
MVRPSDAGAPSAAPFRPSVKGATARLVAQKRGTLIHRLLQALPDIAVERRKDAAQTYLARNAPDWSPDDLTALAESVLALIDNPSFAALFAAGSRAEVPIIGRLARSDRPSLLVSGQIDRLVMTADDVLIADFKTNEVPPTTVADIPPSYVRQMALYRALIGSLYPGRSVRAALVFTETPEIMMIPGESLDRELRQIMSA